MYPWFENSAVPSRIGQDVTEFQLSVPIFTETARCFLKLCDIGRYDRFDTNRGRITRYWQKIDEKNPNFKLFENFHHIFDGVYDFSMKADHFLGKLLFE